MKRTGKFISLLITAAVLMSSTAAAKTVFEGDENADLWTKALYTEQNRLYGSQTYKTNYEWPGTSTLRNSGYPACLLENGSMSINEVFGSECGDLLFTDAEIAKSPDSYMQSGDRLLNVYQMTQWNGFLFVLTGGYGVTLSDKSATDADGNTVSYSVASRGDTTKYDSYLYVFDISKGENYGESRYAKWSMEELLIKDGNPYGYMQGIAVNDDYICILTNNGAKAANDVLAHGVAVFENNIKRGKEAEIPSRIDTVTDDYKYGVKEIIPSSMTYGTANQEFYSAVIGNSLITWSNYSLSLSASASTAAAAGIWVTPIDYVIGATKVYYSTEDYVSESVSSGISLASLLKSSTAGSWSGVSSPVIRDINVNGSEITFLVTYTLNEKYYKEIFVTDWSDSSNPLLLGSISFEDTAAQEAESHDFSGKCYTYDGYIYISSIYGLDIIKKFDYYNNINLTYNGKIDFSEYGYGGYLFRIGVYGDYLFGWVNTNQNSGLELKAKLSEDKASILECVVKKSARRTDKVLVYGGRIYTQWESAQLGDAARQSCIFVADTNEIMPVSLTVDKIEDTVTVPYKITGKGHNIEAVLVNVNGVDMGYVKAIDDGSGEDKWEYIVSLPGDYKITFKGASMEGYVSEGSSESVDFTAFARGDISMTSSYTVSDNIASVNILVSNQNSVSVKVIPVAGLYSDNTMESVVFGTKTEVLAGQTEQITLSLPVSESAVDYKIKTFLIDGLDTVAPLTEAVEN